MDLAQRIQATEFKCEFAVFSGGALRSTRPELLQRARDLHDQGVIKIYEGISKNQYYDLLNDTKVLFNSALQDWVSNTVSEADALGCNVLFPAYRSFPETFANDAERMYVPWSLDDAAAKLWPLMDRLHPNAGRISAWNDGTIDRIVDILQGHGEQWRRDGRNYRDQVSEKKY